MATRTRAEVGEALAALARASRALSAGGRLEPTLGELAEAAALGAAADVAVLWLPQRDGLAARAVSAASAALSAELEGRRAPTLEEAVETLRRRVDPSAETLLLPFAAGGGTGGRASRPGSTRPSRSRWC